MKTSIKVAIVGILISSCVRLLQLEESIPSRHHSAGVLLDKRYRYDGIVAPTATGLKLRVLCWILTRSRLGPILRRRLLLRNGVTLLRDLASQVPDEIAPLHHPIHRLSARELAEHEDRRVEAVQAHVSEDAAEAKGTEHERKNSRRKDPLLERMLREGYGAHASRVMQYHRAYIASAQEQHESKNNGTGLTPVQVIEATIAATNEAQKKYRPFAMWPPPPHLLNRMRLEAQASTERYKAAKPISVFDGVPLAFKDCVNVAGYINSLGSAYYHSPRSPAKKSPLPDNDEREEIMVQRFRELGAIIFPPTSMVEGGVSPVGYNTYFQGPFNPYNPHHYSGGSSGGSAVAVSLGILPVAIGFDGGGSIRTPASFSGVVGLALGFARAPQSGYVGRTNVKTGPLAATVQDAALVYAAITPKDDRAQHYDHLYDGGLNGLPVAHLGAYFSKLHSRQTTQDLAGVTLGIFQPWFDDANVKITQLCQAQVNHLVSRGAIVKHIAIPHLGTLRLAHAVKITSEFALEFDKAYHDERVDWNALEPNTRITVGLGSSTTALEVLAAETLRGWAFDYVHRFIFEEMQVDAIVTPTTSMTAPRMAQEAMELGESNTPMQVELLKFVFLANFLGLPSISVPVGFDDPQEKTGGMPVGLMFTGRQWAEDVLLMIASQVDLIDRRPRDYVDILLEGK